MSLQASRVVVALSREPWKFVVDLRSEAIEW